MIAQPELTTGFESFAKQAIKFCKVCIYHLQTAFREQVAAEAGGIAAGR
jgi:hypothetical protein